jgi:hypothetical protein
MGDKTPEEVFTGEKPKVGHLRIFECPVYIHVQKEKITNMEPSVKKGIFVRYSETSKAYRIYVLGQRHIEVSMDVTFHEEASFKRSKELQVDTKKEEPEAPPVKVPILESSSSDDQREEPDEPLYQFDTVEPIDHVEIPVEAPPAKRRPSWCREILQEVENIQHLHAH